MLDYLLYIAFNIEDNIMFSTELITWPCTFAGVHWLGYLTYTFWDFRGIRSWGEFVFNFFL